MARDKTDGTDTTPGATLATTATRASNAWGIPDWRDPVAYGDTENWTLPRWLWEFTRRRDDYRVETLAYLAFHSEVETAFMRMKASPSPDAKCAWVTLSERAEKIWHKHWLQWGYSTPLDPRVSEYPHDDLLRWPHGGVSSMRGSPVGRAPHARNVLTPAPDQLAVTINLDRPISEQIKLVERAAKREQRARHGRLLQKRRHPTKWLGYLRTLDGRAAWASWAEIAQLHPNTAQTEQAARDVWKAAHDLMTQGWN
jgi:hypothetical protein